MAAVNRSLEHEFEMEYNEEAFALSRASYEDEGDQEEEYLKPLDVIIVSHILSKTEIGGFDCPICLDENIEQSKRVTISCNHNFCMPCTVSLLKSCFELRTDMKCPMCRYPCFLLETPDEPQFKEIGQLLDEFAELEKIYEEDEKAEEAFRYYHFNH